MNKKTVIMSIIFASLSTLSYSQTETKSAETLPPLVGGDTDAHGCKPSAGYTFSVIKNDCVRLFEQEIQLKEVNSKASFSTFTAIIFSDDKRKAEVFVPNLPLSIILTKKTTKTGASYWHEGDYVLLKFKKYVLKKAHKAIYRGE